MIAISYRREDSTSVAGRLHDRLQADFGRKNVFMDFDSIPFGVDFREHIKQTLERAQVVIAVIGPMWLGGRGKNRRINDPSDFVRLEIATALQRGIPVIPVLIDDTPMPQVQELPADLQGLAFRNALVLDTGVDFHHHADRLISGIRDLVKEPASVAPAQPEKAAGTKVEPVQESPAATKEETAVGDPEHRKKMMVLFGVGGLLVAIFVALGWYALAKTNRLQKPALSLATATPVPVIMETPTVTPTAMASAIATESPTPVVMPVVVATPVSIPPPPSPLPTPPDNVIMDDEVRAFVLEHYRATERKDIDYLLTQYDEWVDYNTEGRRDKAFIRNGYDNYFKRWPVASFNVGDVRVIHSAMANTVAVHFQIRYFVRDISSSRSKQGRADEDWVLAKPYGALRIVSEKENVHGEAPARQRSRRY